jgi:hypothetical protein
VTAGFLRLIVSTFRRPPHHQGRDLHRRRRASSKHFAAGYGVHWWIAPTVSQAGIRQHKWANIHCHSHCEPRPASRFVASLYCSPGKDPGSRSQQPPPFTLPRDSPKQYDSVMWVRIGETKWRQSALRGARCWSS